MERPRVRTDVEDGVAHVRLDRPDKLNALDLAMVDAIIGAGEALAGREDVRAVVLSGEGRGFCAGLDLGMFEAMAGGAGGGVVAPGGLLDTEGRATTRAQYLVQVWCQLAVPVVAALHGPVLGGGLQLALGADLRIVHPAATLGLLETDWGLVPDMGASVHLPGLVGLDVAKELVFLGRRVNGIEAVALGLATRTASDPQAEALALAAALAGRSPAALREAKALLDGAQNRTPHEAWAMEAAAARRLAGSQEQVAVVRARLAGRSST